MTSTNLESAFTSLPLPPRQVRRRRQAIGSVGLPILLIVMIGIAGIWPIIPHLFRSLTVRFGSPTMATIDGKSARVAARGHIKNYYVHYQFLLNGRVQSDEQRVEPIDFDSFNTGQKVSIRGWKCGPWIFGVADFKNPYSLNADVIYLCMLGSVIGGVLLVTLYPRLKARRLTVQGTVAAGTITNRRMPRGRSTQFRITYTFKTLDGKTIQGDCAINGTLYNAARVGSTVTVLYDPARAGRNVPYAYCAYEVIGPE